MWEGSQDTSASGSIIHLTPDEIASEGLTLGPRYQTENIEAQLNSIKLKYKMANKNFKIFEHWTHAHSHKSHLTIQCHPADDYVTHRLRFSKYYCLEKVLTLSLISRWEKTAEARNKQVKQIIIMTRIANNECLIFYDPVQSPMRWFPVRRDCVTADKTFL